MKNDQIRHILTRLSIAVIFIGFGAWEIIQPSYWTGFVPTQLSGIASATVLVGIHGTILLVIGLAILLGMYLRITSFLAILIMIEIIGVLLIETGFSDLIIRDVVVLLVALALFFDETRYLTLTK